MARNWMINPRIHCTNHLNGAHCECHVVYGTIKARKRIHGYIKSNCIELTNLLKYHEILVEEMLRRNGNHNSPLDTLPDLSYLSNEEICYKIDRQQSLDLLLDRCPICRDNYYKLYDQLEYIFI